MSEARTSLLKGLRPCDLDAIFRKDLYSFVQRAFPIVSAGDRFQPNWHIEAIADALTRVLDGEIKRLIITVPPRSLKSICASVAFPAFVLGHDPTRRIICVSYSEGLARKHANDFRALVRSPFYLNLFRSTRVSAAKDTELEVMTTARGFRYATSVGGTLTGRGGNLLIIDDPMKPQDAHSENARENLKQWYANTLVPRLDSKADDAIIVVMQRLHVDDLVGHLLEQDGWTELRLPAIAETDDEVRIGEDRVYRRRVGELLHPTRDSEKVLADLKHTMGSLDFAAQYQQQPVAPSGNLIKWSWFPLYDSPPAWQSGDKLIVSWDTAMSAGELADYSACIVLQTRGETVWILDVLRERLDYPDLRRRVIEMHRRWQLPRSYSLVIEEKGSGMSLIQDLKREGIHAIGVKPTQDKVLRMSAHTARIEAGSVYLPRQAGWLDDFRHELMAFPASKHKDQVDALTQALDRAFTAKGRIRCTTVRC
ncbi:phage terminase large subunit [Methyloceanibacter sp. wino2]|uniref:phage terminase large subunit n=1 Tax=Methyloceanibacter sp. wino2 TaxID=2170729 RepID=UPI000D3E1947|nr:phage terminase large subunit [Methyloceanibacter sp. wino2]